MPACTVQSPILARPRLLALQDTIVHLGPALRHRLTVLAEMSVHPGSTAQRAALLPSPVPKGAMGRVPDLARLTNAVYVLAGTIALALG